jgi:glutamyl-tRNA reductase
MNLQMIGLSHHTASVEIRERLAFSPDQARQAMESLKQRFPQSESVVLSTCNRVEIYLASSTPDGCPNHRQLIEFVASFHGIDAGQIFDELFDWSGGDAIRHLFSVASSLDSMVVGEPQILSQVKQAYELAREGDSTGALLHAAFQAANRVAKRVATETAIHEKRVSIPSVAVADYARQFFERFDDKSVLVIGAGEMGEETLRYLIDEGAAKITIINRTAERAQELAKRTAGSAGSWDELTDSLVAADIVVSTTGATEPIVTREQFATIHPQRYQRPLFILDLAVPRDFHPDIEQFTGVYLYSVDDLSEACRRNREAREREWPKAEKIIDDATTQFIAELNHRATGPTIRRLTTQAHELKAQELARLLNKLDDLDERSRREIERFADRLVGKILHPPLESLRAEAEEGTPHGLLDALRRLFKL